ncbi:LCP family protein [Spirochaetia bacterium 38H-sp]|uniref:LCP family protein n=1 Tax=Rarispira pelagica TaxID=3141764 RepID=A0ABU9UG01_9SPIR
MTRKDRERRIIIIVFSIVFIIIFAASFYIYNRVNKDKFSVLIDKKGIVSILFTVHDDKRPLMTELLLFSKNGNGAFLDIPANVSYLYSDEKRIDELALAFSKRGIEGYRKTVESLLNRSVDFVFDVSLENFVNVVDFLEGLYVFVPEAIEMESPNVNIPSGNVRLDGDKIKQLLLYSQIGEEGYPSSSDAVDARYQIFSALLVSMKEWSDYFINDSKFLSVFFSVWDKKMDKASFRALMRGFKSSFPDQFIARTVLGKITVVDDLPLLFPHDNGSHLVSSLKEIENVITSDNPTSAFDISIRIRILNGTTIQGLASRTKALFESFGYDVIGVGNFSTDSLEKTIIIDRDGDFSDSEVVAKFINCDNVVFEQDDTALEDVTVVLGRDFDGRYCK